MRMLNLFQLYNLNEMSLSAEFFMSCTLLQLTFFSVSVYKFKNLLSRPMHSISFLIFILALILILNEDLLLVTSFTGSNSVVNDYLSFCCKFVTCGISAFFVMTMWMSESDDILKNSFEYCLLVITAVLGLLLLISSNDLITAYLSIELQSVAFYLMASFKKDSSYSVESGLKYFIIGSLSSALFLFGSSLLYGCFGSLNFDDFKLLSSFLFNSNCESSYDLYESVFVASSWFYLTSKFLNSSLGISSTDLEFSFSQTDSLLNEFFQKVDSPVLKTLDENGVVPEITYISHESMFDVFFIFAYYNYIFSYEFGWWKEFDSFLFPFNDLKTYYLLSSEIMQIILEDGLPFLKDFGNPYFSDRDDIFWLLAEKGNIIDISNLHNKILYESSYKNPSPLSYLNLPNYNKNSEFNSVNLDNLSINFLNYDIDFYKNIGSTLNYDLNFLRAEFSEISYNTSWHVSELWSQLDYKIVDLVFYDLNLIYMALFLICLSIFIKLSLAPFHLWSLDVYEGAPNATTFFFAVIPKIGLFVFLIRFCYSSFYNLIDYWQSYFILFSILSIIVGSLGGLEQRKLKTLLAYSSISHTGYLILSLSFNNLEGMKMMMYYLVIYMISGLCFWSIFIFLKPKKSRYLNKHNRELGDLTLLRDSNSMLAFILSITLFSIAGIPPIVGFLAKLGVFFVAVKSSAFLISVISILFSVISTFYYIRIIKIIYFENVSVGKLYIPIKSNRATVIAVLSVCLILFALNPTVLYLLFTKALLLFQ